MNKWKTKFSYWKFDKKILLLVTVSILIVTLTVAGVSLTFSIASMKEQSVELLQMQNNTVAESFKGSMDSYKEIVLGTIMDDSVQNYCRQVQKNELKTADIDAVYSKLENLNNMYESLNFAAIVSSDYKSYYYRGKGSLSVTQFEEVYPQAYERSKYAQKGTLKVSYNNDYYNDYYKGNRYTLSLYYPLYDTRKVSDARGLLCMNFDDPAVQRMLAVGDSSAETRVVDTGGMILLSNDKEETGRYVNYIDEMEKGIQIFTKNGNMYVCQKIKNWNYYVVSSISFYKLMESGFHIMVVVILVLIIVLIIVSIIIRALVRKMYQPLNKVVSKMDYVATGSLRTRINVDNMGEDFAKLAIGFNSMMDEIEVLMEQVKLEQHQLEQIRFNALQSQIQPHFLYNTLECIHWQAIPLTKSAITKIIFTHYPVCTTIFISPIQKKSFGSCCPDHSLQSSFYRFYMPSTTASSVWSSASLLFHGFSITPATSASRATSNNCRISARNVDFTAPPPFISSSKEVNAANHLLPSSVLTVASCRFCSFATASTATTTCPFSRILLRSSVSVCASCSSDGASCSSLIASSILLFPCNPRSILVPFCFHSMQFILNNMRVRFIYSVLR